MIKRRTFLQNKLWRDKLPEVMEKEYKSIVHYKNLDDNEYDQQLRLKFLEEVKEVHSAQSKNELRAELADVFEVIDAICKLHEISKHEIELMQQAKRESKGGFFNRKFVTIVQHPEGSFGEKYCLADPNKYPEIIQEK